MAAPRIKEGGPAFGERLRRIRRDRGKSQAELAEDIGVNQRTVSNYESGTAFPPPPVLVRLARLLRISADELLGLKATKTPPKMPVAHARLWKKFQAVLSLPRADQQVLWHHIDSVLTARHSRTTSHR